MGDLYYPLFKGRDGCRTPMPWDAAKPNLGFSSGTPWLPLGPEHRALAVSEQEEDPASALAFTRKLLAARKAHPALRDGRPGTAARAGCWPSSAKTAAKSWSASST